MDFDKKVARKPPRSRLVIPDDQGRMVNKTLGERGKVAENLVKTYLEECHLKDPTAFDWQRMFDARSAGGRFPAQISDFEIFFHDGHGILEVKQVNHERLLPHKNFPAKKYAKIRRRMAAGGLGVMAVYHTPLEQWRFPSIEWMMDNATTPSWDLSKYKLFSDFGKGFSLEIARLS